MSLSKLLYKMKEYGDILEMSCSSKLEEWIRSLDSPFVSSMILMHVKDLSEEISLYFNEEKMENFRTVINGLNKHNNYLPILIFINIYSCDIVYLHKVMKNLKHIHSIYAENNVNKVNRVNKVNKDLVFLINDVKNEIMHANMGILTCNIIQNQSMNNGRIDSLLDIKIEILGKTREKIIVLNEMFLAVLKKCNLHLLFYKEFDRWLIRVGEILTNFVRLAREKAYTHTELIFDFKKEMKLYEHLFNKIIILALEL